MKVSLDGYILYSKINDNYNEDLRVLVNNIFQSEDEGETGYYISTIENLKNKRYELVLQDHEHIKNIINIEAPVNETRFSKIKIQESKLGPIEKKLIECLMKSAYTNIILTGALGSGKTAIIKYVCNYILNNFIHENCFQRRQNKCTQRENIIYINFLKNYVDIKTTNLIEYFKNHLFEEVITRVERILKEQKDLIDKIINYILETDTLWCFKDFIRKYDEDYFKVWDEKVYTEKIKILINWIRNVDQNLSIKLTILRQVLNFISDLFPKRSGCFLIIFDNIDGLPDEIQGPLLYIIWHFMEKTNIKGYL